MPRLAQNPEYPENIQIAAAVNSRLYQRLRAFERQERVTRSFAIKTALAEYLDRHCPQNGKSPEAI